MQEAVAKGQDTDSFTASLACTIDIATTPPLLIVSGSTQAVYLATSERLPLVRNLRPASWGVRALSVYCRGCGAGLRVMALGPIDPTKTGISEVQVMVAIERLLGPCQRDWCGVFAKTSATCRCKPSSGC